MKKYSDKELASLWEDLGDVPINEDREETTVLPFLHFPEGTPKEDIWHWFDEQHSTGLYILMGYKRG